jgi:hypothetical protein
VSVLRRVVLGAALILLALLAGSFVLGRATAQQPGDHGFHHQQNRDWYKDLKQTRHRLQLLQWHCERCRGRLPADAGPTRRTSAPRARG